MSLINSLPSSKATKTIEGSYGKSKEELLGLFLAVSKAQAIIEFELDGTIITANENFLSTLGYTLEEIEGKHHRLFVEQEYANSSEYVSFWKALRSGEYQAAEYKRLAKGGREIWIQASYNPIFDDAGKPLKIVKFATDVTEQKLQHSDTQGKIEAAGGGPELTDR